MHAVRGSAQWDMLRNVIHCLGLESSESSRYDPEQLPLCVCEAARHAALLTALGRGRNLRVVCECPNPVCGTAINAPHVGMTRDERMH